MRLLFYIKYKMTEDKDENRLSGLKNLSKAILQNYSSESSKGINSELPKKYSGNPEIKFNADAYQSVIEIVNNQISVRDPNFLLCRMQRYGYEPTENVDATLMTRNYTRPAPDDMVSEDGYNAEDVKNVFPIHQNHLNLCSLMIYTVLTIERKLSNNVIEFWLEQRDENAMSDQLNIMEKIDSSLLGRLGLLALYMRRNQETATDKDLILQLIEFYVSFINAFSFRMCLQKWIESYVQGENPSYDSITYKTFSVDGTNAAIDEITINLKNNGNTNGDGKVYFYVENAYVFESVSNWLLENIRYMVKSNSPTFWYPKGYNVTTHLNKLKSPDVAFYDRIYAFLSLRQDSFKTEYIGLIMSAILQCNWHNSMSFINEMTGDVYFWDTRYFLNVEERIADSIENETQISKVLNDYNYTTDLYAKLESSLHAFVSDYPTSVVSIINLIKTSMSVYSNQLKDSNLQVINMDDIVDALLNSRDELKFRVYFDMLTSHFETPFKNVLNASVPARTIVEYKSKDPITMIYSRLHIGKRRSVINFLTNADNKKDATTFTIPKYMNKRVKDFCAYLERINGLSYSNPILNT
jgi:predicted house-cleaning noncanonical NTP pyrophosphatase (MazG superfamily)